MRLTEEGPIGDLQAHAMPLRPMPRRARLRRRQWTRSGNAWRKSAPRAQNRPVMLVFGAHSIKNGLAPVLTRLMEKKWVTLLATNGAGIIHDWEFSFQGRSSEDVRANVDLGGTKTAVVLGTPDGEVIARALFATGTPAETRRKITEAAQGFGRDFGRIGIACGGPLDTAQGRLLAPPNLPGGEGAELVPWFASDLRRPVAFENS